MRSLAAMARLAQEDCFHDPSKTTRTTAEALERTIAFTEQAPREGPSTFRVHAHHQTRPNTQRPCRPGPDRPLLRLPGQATGCSIYRGRSGDDREGRGGD